MVASEGNVSFWPNRLWPMEKYHHWLGRSGGYGVGYGAPASVGAALANRDLGRFSLSIQSDEEAYVVGPPNGLVGAPAC